jgi:NADH:ubiquinone oxidoreductase subunit B-like Fe-S oxidoreductase
MDDEPPAGHQAHDRRKVIPVSCTVHGGAHGYTNLAVRRLDSTIELDPHVTGACVIRIDQAGAAALRDTLAEWLG